jgi:hypothetical protein
MSTYTYIIEFVFRFLRMSGINPRVLYPWLYLRPTPYFAQGLVLEEEKS